MSVPPKKIVSKKQYVLLNGKRLWLYADSLLSAGAAMGVLVYTITALVRWKSARASPDGLVIADAWLRHVVGGAVLTIVSIKSSNRARRRAREIESVQPLTDRNVHLLPLEETLVRGSEEPALAPQAILLRAVQKGQETPPEQMLRAGQRGSE